MSSEHPPPEPSPDNVVELRARTRRRTLGPCAHCARPVTLDEHHLRLYRRVWHTECALASPGLARESVGD